MIECHKFLGHHQHSTVAAGAEHLVDALQCRHRGVAVKGREEDGVVVMRAS
jgi:hypothetical protein